MLARWENAELWDGYGNYLGHGSEPPLVLAHEEHICRESVACGAFRCPRCRQYVAWCRGASDALECLECWDSRAHDTANAVLLPLLLVIAVLVIVFVFSMPP